MGSVGQPAAREVLSPDGGGTTAAPRELGHLVNLRSGRRAGAERQAAARAMTPFDSRGSLRASTPLWRRYLRFWGANPAADVEDEFAFHLEMRVEELRAQGLSPKDARDEALRGFGDVQRVKKICKTLAEERESLMRRTQWWSD